MTPLGFVVLSPESNVARLKDTVRSVRMAFGEDAKVACCVPKGLKKGPFEEMNEVCKTYKGGETVTSLINKGFGAFEEDGWRLFIMEGARVPRSLGSRYERWIKGHRDVLFPIVVNHDRDGKPSTILSGFGEATLNGMMIHSSLFKETGQFSENPISISKDFWAIGAAEKGAVFKAILGVKII